MQVYTGFFIYEEINDWEIYEENDWFVFCILCFNFIILVMTVVFHVNLFFKLVVYLDF